MKPRLQFLYVPIIHCKLYPIKQQTYFKMMMHKHVSSGPTFVGDPRTERLCVHMLKIIWFGERLKVVTLVESSRERLLGARCKFSSMQCEIKCYRRVLEPVGLINQWLGHIKGAGLDNLRQF
jgi:hypothetical protein